MDSKCLCWASNWYRSFIVSVDTKGGLDKCARTAAYGSRLLESLLDRYALQPQLLLQKAALASGVPTSIATTPLNTAGTAPATTTVATSATTAPAAASTAAPSTAVALTGSTAALTTFLNRLKLVEAALSSLRRGTRVPGMPGHLKQVSESFATTTLIGRLNTLKLLSMIPYFPLDNAYWFIKIGVLNMDPARALLVARASVLFWGISLVFALAVNAIKLRALYGTARALRRLREAQQQQFTAVQLASPQALAQSQAVVDAALIKRYVYACSRNGATAPDPNFITALQRSGVRAAENVTAVNQLIVRSRTELRDQWVDTVKNATDMVVACSDAYADWSRLTTGFFGTIASVLGWYASWPAPPKP